MAAIVLLAIKATESESPDDKAPPLTVYWRLIENLPDSRFVAELALENVGTRPLDSPWSLYFNTAAKTSLGDGSSPFELSHVNGDLYELRPSAQSPTISPGESRSVKLY